MTYYAIKKGKESGVIVGTWEECKELTIGYPNADFKKFNTEEEAKAYLNDMDLYKDIIKKDIANGFAVAFCDGSFDKDQNRYSYGVLIIDREMQEHEICGAGSNEKYLGSKNIAGEIFGVINAMDWAVSNGYEKIKIYHDLEGLSKWISGEWKADSDVTQMYVYLFEKKFSDILKVEFEKVNGHSNNYYNDKADELAKKALCSRVRVPVKGDNWFFVESFEEEDLNTIIELMKEENETLNVEKDEKTISIIYKIKLDGYKLAVTLFKGVNKKLLVQGKNTILFQMFITFVNELVGFQEEKVFSDAYKLRIEKNKIDRGMQICPQFPSNYPDNIKRLIRQSVINLNYYMDCEDYSQYTFPALRALEGHMKYLFSEEGIKITTKAGFRYFDKDHDTNRYFLPESIINDAKLRFKLEECYNFYNKSRNTICHFGDIAGCTDTTRIIETKEEADEIIKDCLRLICEE